MDEEVVVGQVLFLRSVIASIKEQKNAKENAGEEFVDLLAVLNSLWAEYSVLKKNSDECHAKLLALSKFCGVQ